MKLVDHLRVGEGGVVLAADQLHRETQRPDIGGGVCLRGQGGEDLPDRHLRVKGRDEGQLVRNNTGDHAHLFFQGGAVLLVQRLVHAVDKAQVLPDHRRREHHAEQVAQGQDADAQFRHQRLGLLKQVVTERDEEQPVCDAGSADAVHDMGHEVRVGEDGGLQLQLDGAALHFFAAGQRFVQSGQSLGGEADAVPFGQVDGAQLTDGQVVDLGGELGADVDEVVVVDDEAMVAGLLDVHLNAVGTEVDGVAEGGQGVFGGKVG